MLCCCECGMLLQEKRPMAALLHCCRGRGNCRNCRTVGHCRTVGRCTSILTDESLSDSVGQLSDTVGLSDCRTVGKLSDTVGLYCRTVGPGLKPNRSYTGPRYLCLGWSVELSYTGPGYLFLGWSLGPWSAESCLLACLRGLVAHGRRFSFTALNNGGRAR